jgi:hypothetical protein
MRYRLYVHVQYRLLYCWLLLQQQMRLDHFMLQLQPQPLTWGSFTSQCGGPISDYDLKWSVSHHFIQTAADMTHYD